MSDGDGAELTQHMRDVGDEREGGRQLKITREVFCNDGGGVRNEVDIAHEANGI